MPFIKINYQYSSINLCSPWHCDLRLWHLLLDDEFSPSQNALEESYSTPLGVWFSNLTLIGGNVFPGTNKGLIIVAALATLAQCSIDVRAYCMQCGIPSWCTHNKNINDQEMLHGSVVMKTKKDNAHKLKQDRFDMSKEWNNRKIFESNMFVCLSSEEFRIDGSKHTTNFCKHKKDKLSATMIQTVLFNI